MSQDERQPDEPPPQRGRRRALALLALLPVLALAACKEAKPGSGLETMRHLRERQPGGR